MEITSKKLDEEFLEIEQVVDGDSDDDKTASANSSVVSDVDVDVGRDSFVQLKVEDCRVVYPYSSSRGSESINLVCIGDKSCKKRMGGLHRTLQMIATNRAQEGWYDAVRSRNGTLLGGKPGTRKTGTRVTQLISEANERIFRLSKQMKSFDRPGSAERKKKSGVDESIANLASSLRKKSALTPSKVKEEQDDAISSITKKLGYLPTAMKAPKYSTELAPDVESKPDVKREEPDVKPAVSTQETVDLLRKMQEDREAHNAYVADVYRQMKRMEQDNVSKQAKFEAEIAHLKRPKTQGRYQDPSRFRSDNDEEDRYWGAHYGEMRRIEMDYEKRQAKMQAEIEGLKQSQNKTRLSSFSKVNSGDDDSFRGGSGKKPALYVIAKGHGGTKSVGLYEHPWNEIKFIVEHHSNARYCKVKSGPEGKQFILDTIDELQIEQKPQWLDWNGYYHYPKLDMVRRIVAEEREKEMDFQKLNLDESSDEEDDGYIPQFFSETLKPATKRTRIPNLGGSASDRTRTSYNRMHESASDRNRTQDFTMNSKLGRHIQEDQNNTIRLDESLGDDEKLFGLSINNRTGLINGLTPNYMEERTKRVFFSQLEDFTGYPRTQGKSNDIGESLKDLLSGARDIFAEESNLVSGFTDNGFQDNVRNVLLKIKDKSQLEEIITDLQGEVHGLLGIFQGNLSGILQQAYGHLSVEECNALAQASMVYRIGKDTLERYQSLLLHFHGMTSRVDWGEVKAHLTYHGNKIAKIRNKYHYREAVMCKLYIYLRDGIDKNWSNSKLLQDQLYRLREELTSGGSDVRVSIGTVTPQKNVSGSEDGGNVLAIYSCKHCKSGLHGNGKGTCPFKDDTAAVARKKARQAMRVMSDPKFDMTSFLCQVTADSLSDDEPSKSNKKKDGKQE